MARVVLPASSVDAARLRKAPLLLCVREGRTTARTDWHSESALDARVLQVLSKLMQEATTYPAPDLAPGEWKPPANMYTSMLDALEGEALVAELLGATLKALLEGLRSKDRMGLVDQLEEVLPTWIGQTFATDVVIQNLLAKLRQVPPNVVDMPAKFHSEFSRQLKRQYGPLYNTAQTIDWSQREQVVAAIESQKWLELTRSLRDDNDAHVATLLSLSPEQLLGLVRGPVQTTRIANIATRLLSENRIFESLTLYDAVIERPMDPRVASNPLFAVQDDNHHQGVDAKRQRRYLKRCLPHGPENPAIYLNAACIYVELEEPERALEHLVLAKEGGYDVRRHRNERLFEPLRENPTFLKLMKGR